MRVNQLLASLSVFLCAVSISFAQNVERCEDSTFIIFRDGTAISVQQPDTPLRLVESIRALDLNDLDYSSVTQTLAIIAPDGVYMFSAEDSQPQLILEQPEGQHFHLLAWSPDGQQLAIGVYEFGDPQNPADGSLTLSVYDVQNATLEPVLDLFPDVGDISSLIHLSWSPDGAFIAVTTITQPYEEITRLLSTACLSDSGLPCHLEDILMRPVLNSGNMLEPRYAPAWSPDSHSLGFICGNELCIYDVEQAEVERFPELQMKNILFWMPCDQRIIYQDLDDNLMLRDLESNAETLIVTDNNLFRGTLLYLPEANFLFEE